MHVYLIRLLRWPELTSLIVIIGVVAAILSRRVMYVTRTGKYTVFHFVINN